MINAILKIIKLKEWKIALYIAPILNDSSYYVQLRILQQFNIKFIKTRLTFLLRSRLRIFSSVIRESKLHLF